MLPSLALEIVGGRPPRPRATLDIRHTEAYVRLMDELTSLSGRSTPEPVVRPKEVLDHFAKARAVLNRHAR